MEIKEKDFVEIDFTGRTKEGEIFDSTIEKDLKKLHQGHEHEHVKAAPLVICIGQGMILKFIDHFLIGKEIGKTYEVEIAPEEAFGKRQQKLIQRIPEKVFKEKKLNPAPGVFFNFDGTVGKVIAVSGGRILVDFNHYLAGKNVVYKIKTIRKVEDIKEKVKALNEFFLRKDFDFEVNDKDKEITIDIEGPYNRLLEIFKNKYKEILGMEIKAKEKLEEKTSADTSGMK